MRGFKLVSLVWDVVEERFCRMHVQKWCDDFFSMEQNQTTRRSPTPKQLTGRTHTDEWVCVCLCAEPFLDFSTGICLLRYAFHFIQAFITISMNVFSIKPTVTWHFKPLVKFSADLHFSSCFHCLCDWLKSFPFLPGNLFRFSRRSRQTGGDIQQVEVRWNGKQSARRDSLRLTDIPQHQRPTSGGFAEELEGRDQLWNYSVRLSASQSCCKGYCDFSSLFQEFKGVSFIRTNAVWPRNSGERSHDVLLCKFGNTTEKHFVSSVLSRDNGFNCIETSAIASDSWCKTRAIMFEILFCFNTYF